MKITAVQLRTRDAVGAIIVCCGTGSLYGWSGYLPSVRAAFGLGYGEGSMVFSLAIASFTLGVLFGPSTAGRWPPRLQLPALAALAALFLLGAALSPTFALFAACYGLGFGAAAGAVYALTVAMAARSARAGLLVPLAVACFGLGGALFGALVAELGARGWALWSSAPIIGFVLGGAAWAFAIGNPATAPAQDAEHPGAAAPLTRRQIAHLWAIFTCGSTAGLVVLGLAAQILAAAASASATATAAPAIAAPATMAPATVAIVLAALGNTLGRLSAAPTSRIYPPRIGLATAMAIACLALALLLISASTASALTGLFLIALGYGHVAANMPLLVRQSTSPARFARAFGWVFTGWGVAGLLGPWSAGILRDLTGDFRTILLVCMGLSLIGLILALRFSGPALRR